MKTSRKEDWFVVIGVIVLGTILAVVFLVRNRQKLKEAEEPMKQSQMVLPIESSAPVVYTFKG